MNGDDWQALRDIRSFAQGLLSHAGLLPEGLAAMLRSYELELESALPGRWEGVGNPAAYGLLANRMGQSIADGEWPAGRRLDDILRDWYCVSETPQTIMSALQLLTARGELTLRCGTYYVRSRHENP
jgi:hypothetical protein